MRVLAIFHRELLIDASAFGDTRWQSSNGEVIACLDEHGNETEAD